MNKKFVGKILPNIMELVKGDMDKKQDKMDALTAEDMKSLYDTVTQPPIPQIKVMITDENGSPINNTPIVLKIRDDMGNDGDTIGNGVTNEDGIVVLKNNINTNTRYNLYVNNSSSPIIIRIPNEVSTTTITLTGNSINIENGEVIDTNTKFNGVLIKWPKAIPANSTFASISVHPKGSQGDTGYSVRSISSYPNGFMCYNQSYRLTGKPGEYEAFILFTKPNKTYLESFIITEKMVEDSIINNNGVIEFSFTE